RASQTLHGLKGAWVSEQKVKIEGDKIVEYQVILRLTFVLD
ncbi:MAG: dodecin domain-containing protein, partial [Thermoanaerobaculia bacterium]|nr:dodecin domain-containing protein [Thermoanaerobaculia bacterium]